MGRTGSIDNTNMKRGSQTRKEATMQIPLFSPRQNTLFGTWNVRTMYEAGKTYQLAKGMQQYQLSVLGMCETRWTDSGQITLATGETLLCSGHQEGAQHTEDVGFKLSKSAAKSLIE